MQASADLVQPDTVYADSENDPADDSSQANADAALGEGASEKPGEASDTPGLHEDGDGEVEDGATADADSSGDDEVSQPEDDASADEPVDEAEQADNDDSSASGQAITTDAPVTITTNQQQDPGVVMYRIYNPYSGEHFYTSSATERDTIVRAGWRYEGVGWIAPSSGSPVYRLYNRYAGDHHYTLSLSERNWLMGLGWSYEGIGWYSGGNYKVYRQYNPNAYPSGMSGAHNYTPSLDENNYLGRVGWSLEGVGWYALADTQGTLASILANSSASVRALLKTASGGDVMTLGSTLVNGAYYIFLPAHADLSDVRLSAVYQGSVVPIYLTSTSSTTFSRVDVGGSANVAAISNSTASNGARLLRFTTEQTKLIQVLAVMKSGEIGSVYLTSVNASQGRGYVEASADHSAKANVLVTVLAANGSVIYNQDTTANSSTVKGRGNSTWQNGNKKPYQVKLSTSADLLNSGNSANAAKKWLLIANAADPSLVRNLFAYNFALELGMTGTECALVDLYYDGDYRGTYLLCEKIEVGAGRVDVTNLEKAFENANSADLSTLPRARATNGYGYEFQYVAGATNPDDITGGYVLELDPGYYASEPCWFKMSFGAVVVKSPEYASYDAMRYISEYFETAIRHLRNGEEAADDGKLFDLRSFTLTYLISEMTKEIDTFYSSTYFYKDAGNGKIFAAPIWDYDTIAMRKELAEFYQYSKFLRPDSNIQAASIPLIQAYTKQIWPELSALLGNVAFGNVNAVGTNEYLHSFAYYRQQIAASQRMNQVKFGITSFAFQLSPFETYDLNYNYLVNWLKWRKAWLDDNIPLMNGAVRNSSTVYGGVDYGLVFDASYYRKTYSDLSGMSDAQLLAHFVQYGMSEGRTASRNFNVAAYRNRYADLRNAFGGNLRLYYQHYIQYGFFEGRIAL